MAAKPTRRQSGRSLQGACWNANSVRGEKLELVQFLLDHDVNICLINEMHLVPGQDFRSPNYVCHRNDRPTQGGGTMIIVRRGFRQNAVPISNLLQLEATPFVLTLMRCQ